jgi:hypothetical protein
VHPSSGSAGILWSLAAGDCLGQVSKQENTACCVVSVQIWLLGCNLRLSSSVEDGAEPAGVSVGGRGFEVVFYGCLFSVEGGAEPAGFSVGGMDCENVTCDYLSSGWKVV